MASAALELLISLRDEASSGLAAIAGGLGSIGTIATGGVVKGLTEIGSAAFGMASEVAQSANDMQAQLGVTADRAQELANLGQDIWANNWGGSISEVNAALAETQSQFARLGGIADSEAQSIVQSGFAISDTFGVDVNEAIAAQSTLMQQFGLTAQQAGDLVTKGFQSGLNGSGDFLDTIGEYSNLFAAGGADAAQFFSLIESGMGSGVLGTDKAADAFKEFGIRIRELPDTLFATDGALQNTLGMTSTEVDKLFNGLQDGSVTVADAFGMIMPKLQGMENEVYRNNVGVQLFGTQWEDLGPTIAANMSMGTTSLNDMAGATDSLNAKYANWGAMWEGIKRQALDWIQPLGDGMFDLANSAMPAVQGALSGITTTMQSVVTSFQEGGIGAALDTLTTSFTTWATTAIPAFLAQLATLGTSILTWITTQGPIFAAQLGEWAMAFVGWVSTAIPQVVAGLLGLASALGEWIAGAVPVLATQLGAWATAFIQWLPDAISQLVGGLANVIGTIITWIVTNGPTIIATLAQWGAGFGTWVFTTAIPALLGALGELWNNFTNWLSTNGPSILATLSEWGSAFGTWVTSTAIPALMGALGELWTSFTGWLSANGPTILATLGEWGAAFGTWVTSTALPALTSALGELWTSFSSWLTEKGPGILAQLGEWAAAFGEWVKNPALPNLLAALGTLLTALGGWIAEQAPKIASKVAEWATAFVGWVKSDVVPKIPGALAGILTAIGDWIKSTGGNIANQAVAIGKSVIDGLIRGIKNGIGSVIDAAKNMAKSVYDAAMGALDSHSPSKLFTEVGGTIPSGLDQGIQAGMPKLEKNLINGIAGLSTAAAKALEDGSKAITAAASYSGPSGSGITGFLSAFADLAIHFNDAAISLGGRILGTATRFADTIGKVAGGIGPAIESLTKLADFVTPSQAAIDEFGRGMSAVLVMLNGVGMSFEANAWKAAVIFAEAAGKIVGMVGGAVDSLTKLAGFTGVSEKAIGAFATAFHRVIGIIGWIAQQFLASSIAAAATFAEGAGKITGMIGPAVDSFTKLAGFGGVSGAAIGSFATVFKRVIEIFGWIAQQFLASSIAAAATFAEGAGAMLDMIGGAVDTFAKLAAFSGTPLRAINLFGSALRATVTLLIAIGRTFAADAVAAAGVFGDGAGKAVAFIGGAVESFKKLSEFVAPTQGAIGSFGLALSAALRMLTQVMRAFTTEAVAAAGVFGTEAGKAVSFISNAVGSFTKLAEFVAPTQGAIGSFGIALSATLRMLIQTMQAFAAEAIAAAGAFGDGAGKAVAFIGNAVGGLIKLGEFTGIGQKAIDAFGLGLHATLTALVAMTRTFAAEAIAAAATFGEGVGKAIGFIGNAVESFTKLADVEQIPVAAIEIFAANIVIVIGRIVQLAGVVSAASVAQAAAFAANVAAVVKSVQDALSTFATLDDAKVGSDVLKQFMAAAQALVAQMQAYLPPSANTIGQNTMIGMMNGIVAQRSNLVATMVNTVMAAVMAARAALGIASPSKVFEQIGQFTGAGMAGGMAAMQPAVAGAGAGLGMAAVGGASSGVRSGGGSGASTVNITIAAGAVVNQASTPVDEAKLAARLAEHVDRKLAEKGRGRR